MNKHIIITALCFLFALEVFAQAGPTNGDSYNVAVRTEQFYFNDAAIDEPDFTPSFVMGILPDTDDTHTLLLGSSGVAQNGITFNDRFFERPDSSDNFTPNPFDVILTVENTVSHKFDFTVVSFRWSLEGNSNGRGIATRFQPQFGDYNRGHFTTIRDFTLEQGPSRWNSRWHNGTSTNGSVTQGLVTIGSLRSVKLGVLWRYHYGVSAEEALTFGTISNGDWMHINSNRSAPSGSDASKYGYTNQWSSAIDPAFSDVPDVTYSFTLDSLKEVTISTDYPETNFNTRIHIVRDSTEVIYSNSDKSPGQDASEITTLLGPGDYMVIVEGEETEFISSVFFKEGDFKLNINIADGQLDPGEISHPVLAFRNGCSLSSPIRNQVSGSTSFNVGTYAWEQKIEGDWQEIIGETGAKLAPDVFESPLDDITVRRLFKNEQEIVYSNELIFRLKNPGDAGHNGTISGKVTGKNGVGAVSGVTIYAESVAEGQCEGFIDSILTDGFGEYKFENIYFGASNAGSSFKLYPRFLDHGFASPDTLEFEINSNSEKNGQNFQDTTTLFISGRLYQTNSSVTCGIVGNGFFLNDDNQTPKVSDTAGYYNLSVDVRSTNNLYSVRPDTTNYQFLPVSRENIFAIQNVDGIDFENVRTDTIRGSVTACGGFYFGQVRLTLEDLLGGGCFTFFPETDENGNYEIVVPSRPYIVSIAEVLDVEEGYASEEIKNYFDDVVGPDTVDVTKGSAESHFVYHQAPEVIIYGLPTNTCNGSTDTVFYQGEPVTLEFEIFEENTGNCPLDTGLLIINDQISNRPGNIEIPISNGYVQYTVDPGVPFTENDFKVGFAVHAEDIDGRYMSPVINFKSIIDGSKAREATFTTVSPEIPLLILRDPPGDRSYAYYEKSQTNTYAFSTSIMEGGDVKTWGKVRSGSTFEIGAFGYTTEFDAWASTETGLQVGGKNSSQTESIMSITTQERYQTSADDSGIGADADVFVGAAFNLRYALTDVIAYDRETCIVSDTVALMMGPDSIGTLYNYSANGIREGVIPRIRELKNLASDPAEKNRRQNQIDVWQQVLDRNEDLKANATPDPQHPNRSWDGGTGPWERSTNISSSKQTTLEMELEIESSVATELGLEVAGVGVSGGVNVNVRFAFGGSESETNLESTTVGFVLDDDDVEDAYETEILNDRTYNTPVFRNASSITSCPYTGGSKVDNPVLSVDKLSINNIAPDGQGVFQLTITNGTELPATSAFGVRSYIIDIDASSNPHGAYIRVGGDNNLPLQFNDIQRGLSLQRDISVKRIGSANESIYAYEGLKFELQPVCGSDTAFVNSSVELSAYFNSDCSGATLSIPSKGSPWMLTSSDNDRLSLHITDYDKSRLSNIIIQYSPAGINQWTDLSSIGSADLNDNSVAGEFYDWDVPSELSGEYDLRLKVECSNDVINYSPRIRGIIDRDGPEVFGLPSPIDDVYEQVDNDEISVSFVEEISCANSSVLLIDIDSEEIIPTTLSCSDNKAIIVPNVLLEARGPAAYRVLLSGIEDVYGNAREEYRWVFIVGDYIYDPDCSPVTITNNNLNQDAISQSVYRAIEISSDGTVATATSIGYKAQESVTLQEGFSVNNGGGLEASIENCEND